MFGLFKSKVESEAQHPTLGDSSDRELAINPQS
jgi:hypothetical protein